MTFYLSNNFFQVNLTTAYTTYLATTSISHKIRFIKFDEFGFNSVGRHPLKRKTSLNSKVNIPHDQILLKNRTSLPSDTSLLIGSTPIT